MGVRAVMGHDMVAFLVSSNALHLTVMHPAMPVDRAGKLAAVMCGRLALAVDPLTPGMVKAANLVVPHTRRRLHLGNPGSDTRCAGQGAGGSDDSGN